MSRVRIAVVGGGQSCEHEVGLATATSVCAALDRDRYDVVPLTIGREGQWMDVDGRDVGLPAAVTILQTCDVVFPAVHGPRGEDGTLAALCDLAGVPYVGSGVRAGALAMDKWATKLVAEAMGIRTVSGILLTSPHEAVPTRTPVVVKPVAAGSSHGVTRVDDAADLEAAVAVAFALDDRVLVEDLVTGREIDVAVLGHPDGTRTVGPTLEIRMPDDAFFDTERKYDGSADFRIPADLDDVQRKEIESAAVRMFAALGCSGVARVDFFLTDGGFVLNEVNTMPGLTEQSQVPKMFAHSGLAYPQLLDVLVATALA